MTVDYYYCDTCKAVVTTNIETGVDVPLHPPIHRHRVGPNAWHTIRVVTAGELFSLGNPTVAVPPPPANESHDVNWEEIAAAVESVKDARELIQTQGELIDELQGSVTRKCRYIKRLREQLRQMSDSYVRQGKELVEAQRGRCIFCGRSDEPCQCGKRVHLPLGPVDNPAPHWVCHLCGHVGALAHVCQGDTRTASAVPPWDAGHDTGAYRTLRHRMDLAQLLLEIGVKADPSQLEELFRWVEGSRK